jgi:uracil-DNA glycosylase
VAAERAAYTVFPPQEDVFNALRLVAPAQVRVLLLGQDPYHDDGHAHGLAHGLAFSVRPGSKTPPSLANIFRSPTSSARQHLPLANIFRSPTSSARQHLRRAQKRSGLPHP